MKFGARERDYLVFALFIAFIGGSYLFTWDPGIAMGRNFYLFARDMVLILPPAFILIGLFDVWAKRETIEKHFVASTDARGYVWSILLAATTVGHVRCVPRGKRALP